MNALLKYILQFIALAAVTAAIASFCTGHRQKAVSAIHAPAAEPDTVALEDSVRQISIIFGGDIMQHMPQIAAARSDSTYDYSRCFRYLKPIFDTTDLVIANLETTISADGRLRGYPMFASPPQLIPALKECGFDALMLANNHICDGGFKGIGATIDALEEWGIAHTGAFSDSTDYTLNNPLLLERNGIRLAILNYTYGTNGLPVPVGRIVNLIDTLKMAGDLALIDRDSTDLVIAFMHWGNEYERKANAHQKSLAQWCRRHGIELIIGSHSHTVQPLEIATDSLGFTESVTAYSLGNLISNQRWRYSDGGILLNVNITQIHGTTSSIEVSYLPVWVDIPVKNGRKEYVILPSVVADTLLKEGTHSRTLYDQFMADTRTLLATETTLREITAPKPE